MISLAKKYHLYLTLVICLSACDNSSFSGNKNGFNGANQNLPNSDNVGSGGGDSGGTGVGGTGPNGTGPATGTGPGNGTDSSPKEIKDEFIALANLRPVDIAIVVDNSRSMSNNQKNLSTKLTALLENLNDLDWRIAVTSTDVRGRDMKAGNKDDCYHALFQKGDADLESDFTAAVTLGVDGNRVEQQLYEAQRALEADCPGSTPWLRADSTVAVLIVSDERNGSNNDPKPQFVTDGMHRGAKLPIEEFKSYLSDLRPTNQQKGSQAIVYGIVTVDSVDKGAVDGEIVEGCKDSIEGGVNEKGTEYIDLANQTGGVYGNICLKDYTPVLKLISRNIAKNSGKYVLTHTPLKDSITVTVNGAKLTATDYTLSDAFEMTLKKLANPGDSVVVTYKYLP